jgi:transcription initiation factor TFIIF subunit alpha
MSLTQFNQTKKADNAPSALAGGPIPVEALRNEYLQRGARAVPLVVTRKDLKQLRHHVMRLHNKQEVDVQDEEQFTPPIRLHRRDPRAPPSGAGSHFDDDDTKEDLEESKERERMEIAREERRKTREENQAKIAPTGTKKPPAFQKKTEQKYRADDTPAAKKRQLLRYEETLPWHLEDFENKQTWTGTYESEMSEAHVMLTSDTANAHGQIIQMAPLERWYRFNPKTKAKSTEDPDLVKVKTSGYFTKLEQKSKMKQEQDVRNKGAKGIRTRVGGGDDDEGRIRRRNDDDDMPAVKREADADDIDFNMEEDFADDEEGLNGLFEGDDLEVKEASERLKRDQLGAAAFDLRNEDEIYRQEERAMQEEEMQRQLEKALRKTLVKREKNIDYETDNDNPYASTSSEDTDSETERQRAKEEQEKKAAEQAAEQNGKAAEGDKTASGASTKGATTPSGNHRSSDVNKKKRPGSPNLSEASGNESSRKKHKKKHGDGSRKSSLAHLNDGKRGAASGSDSEMTDAGKTKKTKLKVRLGGSPGASPSGSRAGSPAAGVNGSRAGSPAAGSPAAASREFILPNMFIGT